MKKIAVHDDSHAKAILKGELYKNRIKFESILKKKMSSKKGSIKNYDVRKKYLIEMFAESIFFSEEIKNRSGKRKITNFFVLGPAHEDNKKITVSYLCLDSRREELQMDQVFFISSHFLGRLIRRSDVRSLDEIVKKIKNYLISIIFSGLPEMDIYKNVQYEKKEGLVLIFDDAYIPCHVDQNQFILKTIVTRDFWSVENEAKLNNLSKKLTQHQEILIMTTTEFNKKCYIDFDL